MEMYVVLGREDEWEADTYVVGVYSSREKAQEIINGVARETFPNDVFWIDENTVDAFGWEKADTGYDEDDYDECGFDPYEGCYTHDCQVQRKRGN